MVASWRSGTTVGQLSQSKRERLCCTEPSRQDETSRAQPVRGSGHCSGRRQRAEQAWEEWAGEGQEDTGRALQGGRSGGASEGVGRSWLVLG